VGSRDAPAIFFERNNSCLTREHFNSNAQNARKKFLKIKLLR
jgi:hypothetical protein